MFTPKIQCPMCSPTKPDPFMKIGGHLAIERTVTVMGWEFNDSCFFLKCAQWKKPDVIILCRISLVFRNPCKSCKSVMFDMFILWKVIAFIQDVTPGKKICFSENCEDMMKGCLVDVCFCSAQEKLWWGNVYSSFSHVNLLFSRHSSSA